MIIPARISVAEIIDSPGFRGFRRRALAGAETPPPTRTTWRTPEPNPPIARKTSGPGRRARAGKEPGNPASALRDDEVRSAVRGVGRYVLARIERLLFTDRRDRQAGRIDAELDHVVERRLGALLAEHEVVLVGAANVAVAFDRDLRIGMIVDPVSYTHLTL